MRLVILAASVFAVGFFCGRGVSPRQLGSTASSPHQKGRSHLSLEAASSSRPRDGVSADVSERIPSATVEVIYADGSGEPDSAVAAAHCARREGRAAARAEKAASRRDFLSSLNLDLLTPGQRKLHAEYTEAVNVRDAARAEILSLRDKGGSGGGDVRHRLDDLQGRLAEAESVIRASAEAEHRALQEAVARAYGLEESAVHALCEDLDSVDSALGR